MVLSAEFLGMLLLVTSAAALGLSIVIDVGQVTSEKARQTMMMRQHDRKRAALGEWTRKLEQRQEELAAFQARVNEANGRRQKALSDIRALELTKVEFVHELGEGDEANGFWVRLTVQDEFPSIERRDVIFARQIWSYPNVAHVWTASADQAAAMARAVFSVKNGVLPSMILPIAQAPDPDAQGTAA
ncbi:hypothetical protein [Roseomonas genomospecies 6]|uniref:Uncharacterized protein n=1 Tax=Roseomonas genomospecies 6 TaxID=214106 RepID=A0A9W7NGP6_9PROT|nr:hypothetical protein [Roseomonas genomospecies 6]KAA0677365.1 hypothetical protein DS843_23620 [Roseomonas genomospecies 6]